MLSKSLFVTRFYLRILLLLCIGLSPSAVAKTDINALYIPLADHYAAIVAYELYKNDMQYANFSIEQMPNWDLLRAKFLNKNDDMAFVMSPLAMSMYAEKPIFKWIGLMHRDGNALATTLPIREKIHKTMSIENTLIPNISSVINEYRKKDMQFKIGVPHLLSTHTVVLYSYLKAINFTLKLSPNAQGDIFVLAIAPAKSPAFLRGQGYLHQPAAIEQSLPWADLVQSQGAGKIVWYSKDILPSKYGHVECIALASNNALEHKEKAVEEVFNAIKRAGNYIEQARYLGGDHLNELIRIITKHIPAHTPEAIRASLNPNINVINYQHLDIDKEGLNQIMQLALEAKLLKEAININQFAYSLSSSEGNKDE